LFHSTEFEVNKCIAIQGLLFPQFAYLSNKRQIPLFGTIVTAIFATALALFFDINSLTNMISFGTLLAFSTVCGGIVLLRFKESVEVNNELPSFVSLDRGLFLVFCFKFDTKLCFDWHIFFCGCVVSRRYSRFNSLEGLARAIAGLEGWILVCYFCFCALFGAYALHFDRWGWPWWSLIVAGVPLVICVFLLSIRVPSSVPSTFKCPLVPFLPMIAILVNVYLMIGLPFDAIYRTAIWCAFGVLLYFLWGIRHSKLNFQTRTNNSAVPSFSPPSALPVETHDE
jgi:amino acid transporter